MASTASFSTVSVLVGGKESLCWTAAIFFLENTAKVPANLSSSRNNMRQFSTVHIQTVQDGNEGFAVDHVNWVFSFYDLDLDLPDNNFMT